MKPIDLIQQYIAESQVNLAAINTFTAARNVLTDFVMDAVQRLLDLEALTGEEKYDLVMQAVSWLFDYFVGSITLPWYLRWLLWLAKPDFRAEVLAAADSVLEAFYARVK